MKTVTMPGWLALVFLMTGLVPEGPAQETTAKILKFDFGTPDSVTRAGFAKVTPKDIFKPDRGWGFESAQGLQAFDRGGATPTLPNDPHAASVYGASRSTSDITCDLIEGEHDNAFLATLPDGVYTVWAIASDAAWDPPLFEIWANGKKKLDMCVPRAHFVTMEPFQARAEGGRLRIELKGRHGWLLNGLVIGQEGPEMGETITKLKQDIFFLTDRESAGWKEAKSPPANPPLELTPAERQKGYVIFAADPVEQIVPSFIPARVAIDRPLTAFATPGEFEPVTFGLAAQKELGAVAVECSDFVGEKSGQKIERHNVSVGIVRCWPQRQDDWGEKGQYRIVPEMIEPPTGRPSRVQAAEVKQWWLTVHVPENTPAGRYRMALTVRPEKATPTVLEWRLLVLPFELTRPADRHWGTWLESFPPVGGLHGPERRGRNTPEEAARLARNDMTDFRDHGFDLVVLNYYFGVTEQPDGSFVYDISKLQHDLELLKLLGSQAPVVIGFEYTCRNLEYQFAEPGRKHLPGSFSPKARQAIVGLVRRIHDEAQRHPDWPRLYYFPIDEPGNNKTENRLTFAENVLDFVHEVPGCQTATTLTASDAQRLGDRVDVRIYAFGHYTRDRVMQESRQGHPFWYYENGMFYGHSTLDSRATPGLAFLRSGAAVAMAWGFAATYGNPENDFDAGHKDWNTIFPGVDTPTPTIYWELCREGVDDCRYVATLQERIRQARTQGKTTAAQRAEEVLKPLLAPDAQPLEQPLAFGRYRWRIAREILTLLGDQKFALPFTAVTENAPEMEKAGPNVIENPSFESGPQADGFPGGGYHIADQYSKQAEKPVGALNVADEAAHSGRYALKWDFSKAAGKGSLYDGNRYLIVNVQAPQAAARSLRGKRVKVGYWFRLGGGALAPGMTLRQSAKGKFLGGIAYTGGVQDPAVWNHFEAEGRLRDDFESLDIHISCRVPEAEVAKKSFFYIDDVSLQAIEEPPLTVSTPLDEYYTGEPIPWTVSASTVATPGKVALFAGDRLITEQTCQAASSPRQGTFASAGLKPGVYTVRASLDTPQRTPQSARTQLILAPDPFAWPESR